ncbi:MAG: hypothetical protein JWO36_1420 [Myxococcales bacterium]|nr:hypothetical protein [Myxococcales bacterium]
MILGEMCPQGAGGRPAVDPLIMRGIQWTDAAADVVETVERGSVPRFIVFGVDGKMAGVFDTLGVVDIGVQQSVATGTYVGASPCTYALSDKPSPGQLATRAEDPACGPVTNSCGIAVGEITHPDDPPITPAYTTGAACVSGDQLAVDIDGDGRVESFPISGVLDGIRGPAAEWSASPAAPGACTPHFQVYDIKLLPEPDPGKPVDQKSAVMLDVLGVVDLDGDGRRELVLALRFPTVRSIVVYSPSSSAQRLELVGESPSFPR